MDGVKRPRHKMPPAIEDATYREIGRRVRLARKNARLSQEQLARRIQLERTSLSQIETGHQRITITTLYRLCDVLGMEPNELLPPNRLYVEPRPAPAPQQAIEVEVGNKRIIITIEIKD